mmetsp:Transcript_23739/g.73076  ORF Transcript_23739/g.73076 Transcript_23739/m.73076 type:complete len:342 (-) Transcript_23739:243-1268(-)
MSDCGKEERSCGVMKMNCLSALVLAISTSSFMATLRATWSMKTSNSSMTRKGVSTTPPMAMSSASVVKERSPPLKELTLLSCVESSLLSFWNVTFRVLVGSSFVASCLNVSPPEAPLLLRMSLNLPFVFMEIAFWNLTKRFHRFRQSLTRALPSALIFVHSWDFLSRVSRAFLSLASTASRFVSVKSSRAAERAFRRALILVSTAFVDLNLRTSASEGTQPANVVADFCVAAAASSWRRWSSCSSAFSYCLAFSAAFSTSLSRRCRSAFASFCSLIRSVSLFAASSCSRKSSRLRAACCFCTLSKGATVVCSWSAASVVAASAFSWASFSSSANLNKSPSR